MTLKQGVENMLMHYVPEVKEVGVLSHIRPPRARLLLPPWPT